MKPYYCAAVDLGATSGRVILGSYTQEGLQLDEVHRFPNQFHEAASHCYWNLPGLFSEIRAGLRKAVDKVGQLDSCGVDAWGVDHVLVDKNGRMVFPSHAYRDRRTEPYREALNQKGLKEVYSWTGLPNLPLNSSLQLQELADHYPELAQIADRCLFLPDYFNFLLSGVMENEISIASTSQLLDVHGIGFSEEAIQFFGLPLHWFRKPALAGKKLGKVTGISGLEQTDVILVPGHDTCCAYDAMPSIPGYRDIFLSSGTWSLIGFESDTPLAGEEALTEVISNERLGNGRYRPLKNCLGLWLVEETLKEFSERPRSDEEWQALIQAAEEEEPPGGLLDVTDNKLFNPSSMKGAINEQLRSRSLHLPESLPAYVRLILESLGAGHAHAVKVFERMTGKPFDRILIVGGGSKNRLLCQATANCSKLPVHSFNLEGTAVGNIGNQLLSLGAIQDLTAFRKELASTLEEKRYDPA